MLMLSLRRYWYRMKTKDVFKIVVLLLIIFFGVPYLFAGPKIDPAEHSKDIKDKDAYVLNRHRGDLNPKFRNNRFNLQPAAGDGKEDRNEEGHQQVLDKPMPDYNNPVAASDDDKVHLSFGPKAIYDDSKLGNFEPINFVGPPGPGEGGVPVYTSIDEQARVDRSVRENGFNLIASEKIAMNRSIPDTRLAECKYWQYPTDLPTASVIIVFHNEGFSTLVRTVHSIINTSPKHLLHEVVMVDDFSSRDNLKGPLEEYIKKHFRPGLVNLYRNEKREGLIRTRTLGAKYSKGDVIVFLDAHCEGNRNWLVPLLARVRHDRTIMAVPIVDGIDWKTFRYASVYGGTHHRGIFEWGFLYKESQVPDKELNKPGRTHSSEPYWAPTHAGGLFAMDRKYFFELGGYDPGLQIWGGENFELSFKIWQCGGKIEWVPCSRVGHVYRTHMPYSFGNIDTKIPVIQLNYLRVVSVWLEPEFQEYFYTREPSIRGYPIGDVQEQLDFKRRHKCKPFGWFMKNVAYEVFERFPRPPPNLVWGEVQMDQERHRCWDAESQEPGRGVRLGSCHHVGGNQLFRLNTQGQMGLGERCIDVVQGSLQVQWCPVETSGPWEYNKESGLLKHKSRSECIQAFENTLRTRSCDRSDFRQKWHWAELYPWKR